MRKRELEVTYLVREREGDMVKAEMDWKRERERESEREVVEKIVAKNK